MKILHLQDLLIPIYFLMMSPLKYGSVFNGKCLPSGCTDEDVGVNSQLLYREVKLVESPRFVYTDETKYLEKDAWANAMM